MDLTFGLFGIAWFQISKLGYVHQEGWQDIKATNEGFVDRTKMVYSDDFTERNKRWVLCGFFCRPLQLFYVLIYIAHHRKKEQFLPLKKRNHRKKDTIENISDADK